MPSQKRLKTIDDVRRYLASLILRLEDSTNGEIDGALAGRLGYLSNILLGAIKDGDLEKRITALEERMKQK